MISYKGYACPVCGKAFEENDDIVVCPECGAPHHRRCWEKEGRCGLSTSHSSDFSWNKVRGNYSVYLPPDNGFASGRTKVCPKCNCKNDEKEPFCRNCGFSFFGYDNENYKYEEARQKPVSESKLDPLNGIGASSLMNGVPAGDVAKFIGPNTAYYLPVFQRIARTGKARRFNFAAFLFTGPWMLYRKQYKRGAIFLAIVLLLEAVSLFVTYRFSAPISEQILSQAGIDSTNLFSLTAQQQMAMMNGFWDLSVGQLILFFLPMGMRAVLLAFSLWVGWCANRWYYQFCISRVKEINKNAASTEEFNDELVRRGRINLPLTLCLLVCYFILNYFESYILPTLIH